MTDGLALRSNEQLKIAVCIAVIIFGRLVIEPAALSADNTLPQIAAYVENTSYCVESIYIILAYD